jgi:hypothetical protein
MFREIFEFLTRMSLSNNQMQRDIQALRAEISDLKETLIPFSKEEMELLSLSSIIKGKKRGYVKVIKGVVNTVHFEALVAFAIKSYSPDHKLILVTTSDIELIYFVKGQITHVYFDGQELGFIDTHGKLYNVRRQLIAQIDGNDHLATHTVQIKGQDFGFTNNPKFEEKREIKRAFQILKPMNEDELSIFLCLTLINLVEESML